MVNVQQNQTPTLYHQDTVVSPRVLTVRESVASELANDVSEDREEAEQLLVARSFPALAFRAGFNDELNWDELLGLSVTEATAWEKEEQDARRVA